MTQQVLLIEQREHTLWLTMNQPGNMNALGFDLVAGLRKSIASAATDDSVRVLVIAGAGRAFCAGADLKTMTQPYAPGEPDVLDVIVELFEQLRQFPKPVIAAVNGLALAGGMELMMCCDLIYAARSAKIGDAHCNYGIVPGGGGAAIMPRMLPLPIAKYLLFTGEFLPAETLQPYGLINEVVDDDQLLDQVAMVASIICQKSPLGLARAKKVANAAQDKSAEDSLYEERLAARDQFRSYDYQEGIRAFIEKRKPHFKGY
jgi:enoyl-CoA hydratase/carnithine racemase